MVLDKINKVNDIKDIPKEEYDELADEIRNFLIEVISKNGGHLASNLGVVELTMALHLALDLPEDKIIFDVGHQSYTHKILTGRKECFDELRSYGGMSGFPKRRENECDCFDTGHSSTSISAGLGIVTANEIMRKKGTVVSVIGDGALSGGMAYEGLNNAARLKRNFIIILNDNNMSISENVGGMSTYLSNLRAGEAYNELKNGVVDVLNKIPAIGGKLVTKIRKTKSSIKQLVIPGMLFEDMGITYLGPVDGHNINQLVKIISEAKKLDHAVLIHVITKKGKGYIPAEKHPSSFHGVEPFNIQTGLPLTKKEKPTYTDVFAKGIVKLAKEDEAVAAITAAMVKELRESTGAGMMECKKALTETDGDMEAAVDVLRKSGAAKVEKKAGRIAAEGITRVAYEGNTAVVVEVNSETDFVAKNATFQEFVQAVADKALKSSVEKAGDGEDVCSILDMKSELEEKTLTIGEKLSIRRFEKLTGDCVASYIHGGGRIGVLVAAEGASGDAVKEALTNIAMQIAAMNPEYISRNDMSADELAKLREIIVDSALNDPATLPKPILNKLIEKAISEKIWSDADIATYEEHKSNMQYLFNFLTKEAAAQLAELALADKADIVADKIFNGLVEGRVSKQLKEICLMDQVYVKAEDGKQSVAKYIAEVGKAAGSSFTIKKFVRFEVGEGLEKKNEDFAAEVAAQLA